MVIIFMHSFTDDDLKRLNEYEINWLRNPGVLNALITRLETAEAYIYSLRNCDGVDNAAAEILWRRAAGKI